MFGLGKKKCHVGVWIFNGDSWTEAEKWPFKEASHLQIWIEGSKDDVDMFISKMRKETIMEKNGSFDKSGKNRFIALLLRKEIE